MKRPNRRKEIRDKKSNKPFRLITSSNVLKSHNSKNLFENSQDSFSVFEKSNSEKSLQNKNEFYLLKHSLECILEEIKIITQKLNEDEEEEQSLNWKFAAMVIDKLCIYIFSFATFLSTALILFTSPNLYRSSDPDPIF